MACRALQQPRLDVAVRAYGGDRRDWERIHDLANLYRHDAATLRAIANIEQAECISRRVVPLIRRGGRGGGRAPTTKLAAQFRGLFLDNAGNPDVWADYSFVAIDGVSGKLQSLVDYIDNTHLLSQANTALQPAAPAVDASFSNAASSAYSGTVYLDSSRTSTFWGRWQDGSGGTLSAVYVPTNLTSSQIKTIYSTGNSATQNSIALGIVGATATGTGYAQVFKTAASNSIIVNTSSAASDALNVAISRSFKYASAGGPNFVHKKGAATLGSGAEAFAPGAGASQAPLRIGSSAVIASNGFIGRQRAHYFWRRYLNAAEESVREAWVQKDAGVAP